MRIFSAAATLAILAAPAYGQQGNKTPGVRLRRATDAERAAEKAYQHTGMQLDHTSKSFWTT